VDAAENVGLPLVESVPARRPPGIPHRIVESLIQASILVRRTGVARSCFPLRCGIFLV
jgi:hypothetical protein